MAEQIEGLADLNRRLLELGPAASGKALRSAVNVSMTPVLKRARANAPVGSVAHKTYRGRTVAPGFLRRSVIKRTRLSRDKQSASSVVGVRGEAFYGVQFLEFGTSKMPAKPWLRKSFYPERSNIERGLAEKLRNNIEKAARK